MSKAKINKDTRKITCTSCNRSLVLNNSNFYKSTKSEYEKTDGFCYICKSCVRQLCFNSDNTINMNGLLQALEMLDKPFIKVEYMKILSKGSFDIGTYLKNVSFNSYKGMTFADSDNIDKNEIPQDNNKSTNSDEDFTNIELTDEDKVVKDDVIRLIGYDPFSGYGIFDQKFLYNELMPYLDEDTLDDSFKLSQIIQIINNNNQVRKIDFAINKMSSNVQDLMKNQGEIKSATAIKNQIVTANDKIAKENSISVKNRGDKSAGKSTLTYLMRNYRELGFEDAEQDYYDENKAKGMQMVADISNKSIIQQLQLDENDINDMLFTQRQLIQELQSKVDDLQEENRQLYVQITEFKQNKGGV